VLPAGFAINGMPIHARGVRFLNGRLRNIRQQFSGIAGSLTQLIDKLREKIQEAGTKARDYNHLRSICFEGGVMIRILGQADLPKFEICPFIGV